ncbi:MAG: primosomal protein N' [Erysipelothrix sp.]|nr:primosomal protein N' [Erysipelothrix sp.]
MKQYINVWVERNIPTLEALTYQCNFYVEKGMRVMVPLQSKHVVGIVSEVNVEVDGDYEVKEVVAILDDQPIFSATQFELLEHMHHHSVTNPITLLKAMLPSVLKPSSVGKKPVQERFVVLKDASKAQTKREHELVEFLKQKQPLIYKEYRLQAKSLTLKLIDKGIVEVLKKDKEYYLMPDVKREPFHKLNQEQQKAYEQVKLNEDGTYLLFGVTGSGKTEIFMHLVRDCLANQKNAMVLVPEVALTPQMIARFSARFDCNIAVYHSHLSENEQYHQYMQIKEHKANIIIGTRSAIFLPMTNLGIIIMDEEHDVSFKQDTQPYYHARDVASFLSEKHQCPLLLASATPSLESYARALKGVYHLLQLKQRINASRIHLQIVNMRTSIIEGHPFLSKVLIEKMQDRLEKQEQVILLLNRRGYAPYVYCEQCFEIARCQFCEQPLTYHQNDKKLHCHRCDHVYDHYACQHCNHQHFVGSGIATQRLENVIQSMFKTAKVGRLDYDSTRRRRAHHDILSDFANHKYDVLIGTQMVAKGLDIPNVTLVGILQADAGLLRNDFHSNESTYAMISQAAGRSGRHDKQGEVIIQVFNEDHYVIDAIQQQDYELFFKQEMHYRKLVNLPPYVYLISCIISHYKKTECQRLAYDLSEVLRGEGLHVVGPSDLGRTKNHYRYRVLVKTKNLDVSVGVIKDVLSKNHKLMRYVNVNVSPLYLE